MKVLLVNGSPREHGCTDTALAEVAGELRAAYMYHFVTGVADRHYVFKLLHGVRFVIAPPFVRFEAAHGRAAYHTPAPCAGVCSPAHRVPAARRQQRAKI